MIKEQIIYNFMNSCMFLATIRVWFVRLYGKIIHKRKRVDYRPYRPGRHEQVDSKMIQHWLQTLNLGLQVSWIWNLNQLLSVNFDSML